MKGRLVKIRNKKLTFIIDDQYECTLPVNSNHLDLIDHAKEHLGEIFEVETKNGEVIRLELVEEDYFSPMFLSKKEEELRRKYMTIMDSIPKEGIYIEKLIKEVAEKGIPKDEAKKLIENMKKRGFIYERSPNYIMRV